MREAVLEPARESLRVVAELDRADAAFAAGDEDRAERALPDREADLGAGAAGPEPLGVIPSTLSDSA
jgi:hypothetical protein